MVAMVHFEEHVLELHKVRESQQKVLEQLCADFKEAFRTRKPVVVAQQLQSLLALSNAQIAKVTTRGKDTRATLSDAVKEAVGDDGNARDRLRQRWPEAFQADRGV